MNDFLNTPIEYAKGVGPRRAEVLKAELNVHTFGDVLECYPFRYIDRSKFYKTTEINSDVAYVQLKGKISNLQTIGEGRNKRMTAMLIDEFGEALVGIRIIVPSGPLQQGADQFHFFIRHARLLVPPV